MTVTDANGNITVQTYVVTEPPLLTAIINQSVPNLTVNANGGTPPYSYIWSTGDTLSTIMPLTNGNYTCTVYDKQGCVTSATFDVTNMPTNISEFTNQKRLVKVVDFLGRETPLIKHQTLFLIYNDGSVERRYIVD